jgi:hypothetical protein
MQAHVWQKIMFIYNVIATFLTFTCFNSPKKRGYDTTYVAKAYDICFRLVTPLYKCVTISMPLLVWLSFAELRGE